MAIVASSIIFEAYLRPIHAMTTLKFHIPTELILTTVYLQTRSVVSTLISLMLTCTIPITSLVEPILYCIVGGGATRGRFLLFFVGFGFFPSFSFFTAGFSGLTDFFGLRRLGLFDGFLI